MSVKNIFTAPYPTHGNDRSSSVVEEPPSTFAKLLSLPLFCTITLPLSFDALHVAFLSLDIFTLSNFRPFRNIHPYTLPILQVYRERESERVSFANDRAMMGGYSTVQNCRSLISILHSFAPLYTFAQGAIVPWVVCASALGYAPTFIFLFLFFGRYCHLKPLWFQ